MNILLAIDGTDPSFRSLDHAASLFAGSPHELHIVHVTYEETEMVTDLMQEATDAFAETDITYTTTVLTIENRELDPQELAIRGLEEYLTDHEIDHLIVGDNRKTSAEVRSLGSVSTHFRETVDIPITLIPRPTDD